MLAEIDGDRITFPGASYHEGQRLKPLPGTRWSPDTRLWSMALSWAACQQLRAEFGAALEIGPELTAWAWREKNERVDPSMALRLEVTPPAESPLLEALEKVEAWYGELGHKLFEHQRAGALFMATAQRGLLGDEVGTGKSATTIAMLNVLRAAKQQPLPVLIVCPNSMKRTWQREFTTWAPDLDVRIVTGSLAKRQAIIDSGADVLIINWEGLKSHSRLAPYGSIALRGCVDCDKLSTRKAAICERCERDLNVVPFATVITDECFVEGTVISTPTGRRAIESLQVGDVVWGYDHANDSVVPTTVIATMNRLSECVVDGVTPNHPFFTADGYRRYGDLREDDTLYALDELQLCLVPKAFRAIRQSSTVSQTSHGLQSKLRGQIEHWKGVWPTINNEELRLLPSIISTKARQKDLLLGIVQEQGSFRHTRSSRTISSGYEKDQRDGGAQAEDSRPNAWSEQPGEGAWCEGVVVSRREKRRSEQEAVWVERSDTSDADALRRLILRCTTRVPSLADGWFSTGILRDRYRFQSGQAGDRSRRSGASLPRSQDVRRPPNDTIRSDGLDRHTVLELRDWQRYFEVCAAGSRDDQTTRVFSLTTATGNYFANEVLVKNCHKVKNPRSVQTRAAWAIAHGKTVQYSWALTGTPIANHPGDLWSVMHLVAPHENQARSKWLNRYALLSWNLFGGMDIVGLRPEHREEFFRIFDPRFRRMPKELVLPFLPPKLRQTRYVTMHAKQERAYKRMKEHMVALLEDDDAVIATSPLVQATRLLQFSSSYAEISEDGEDVLLSEPSCKLDAMDEILEELGEEPLVVCAESAQLIRLAAARLLAAGIKHSLIIGGQGEEERQRAIDDFQSGAVRVCLFTMKAGGVGLTLTRAGHILFLQRSWSMIDNKQAEGRIHRIGSEIHDKVLVIDLITEGTIETHQLEGLAEKLERSEEIVRDRETLRAMLA